MILNVPVLDKFKSGDIPIGAFDPAEEYTVCPVCHAPLREAIFLREIPIDQMFVGCSKCGSMFLCNRNKYFDAIR